MVTSPRILTEQEFLDLPEDDRFERQLIRGELQERPMTTRGFPHSLVMMRLGQLLLNWIDTQPKPHGRLIGGEARVRLQPLPPTFVGVDLAYIAPDKLPAGLKKLRYADGPPALVVEILSPREQEDDVDDKIELYFEAGVPLVWIARPRQLTVTVHRPDAPPRMFNIEQELSGEPHLPGFAVPVARIFEGLED
ncbi:Uma2 family endonuclease [Tundrisphaera sp. TA3]|uniref:Uma2 family endonuclease n=1 Tax=Tundrisphaera sp. TA3 TaxID=3435775 RepID=UPI003EBA11E1